MNVIAVASAKGGVGKTTVSANLGVALARLGRPVLAVDLDPQNALRFHYFHDQALSREDGMAKATVDNRAPGSPAGVTPSGVVMLPYGHCSESEREQFESILQQEPDWLRQRLSEMGLPANTLVVLDTPPGPSVYLKQALRAANFVVVVVLADAGSYITLPQMHELVEQYCDPAQGFVGSAVLINQVDRSRALASDVTQLLNVTQAGQVLGRIHADPAVAEALACGTTVFEYMEHSEAVRDFQASAREVLARLHVAGAHS
ncbi:MAG TPA: cellulose biosynthesis protein BcsQ [Alcaligenes sp.]|nr:cellulose biosynthesis protein BcsQ [Alcaligenes sp.]HRL27340.1 cellulose biosynthesis protein BcsQ [Alcaligenes sp.]